MIHNWDLPIDYLLSKRHLMIHIENCIYSTREKCFVDLLNYRRDRNHKVYKKATKKRVEKREERER